MRKSITVWTDKDWDEDFYRGDEWHFHSRVPKMYSTKKHVKDLNGGLWRKQGKAMFNYFRKIRITIEDLK